MLSEPTILMLMPAALVLVGVFTGVFLWRWLHDADQHTIEDLHDEIRRLSKKIDGEGYSAAEATGLLDLQFENDELQVEAKAMTQKREEQELELVELRSMIQVQESEMELALKTISSLRQKLGLNGDTAATAPSNEVPLIQKPELVQAPQPTILRADFEKVDCETPQPNLLTLAPLSTAEPNKVESESAATNQTRPSLDTEYGGEVRFDASLGWVYTRPPMVNDNLQLISGIASKLEQQLNGYGVYTFQQISLWDSNNIEQFSQCLDTFQGRIERDNWVHQATVLYHKTRKMRRAA